MKSSAVNYNPEESHIFQIEYVLLFGAFRVLKSKITRDLMSFFCKMGII